MAVMRQEWHDGEKYMHSLLRAPEGEYPKSSGLSPYGSYLVVRSPLLALGVLDTEGRPWTTVIGGEQAFMRPLGQSIIGVRSLVDLKYDPVLEVLRHGREQDGGVGRIISGLPIDLATRNRIKISGRLVPGGRGLETRENDQGIGEAQFGIKVESSLGNCPKYLNKKQIIPAIPEPAMIADSLPLPDQALKLLARADMFFISSSNHDSSMGTNHRGGPPGFVRVLRNDVSSTSLIYPEYSGNRLYQTLGNLHVYSQAGLVVPDFDTQDVLYMTGTTEIIIGKEAAALLPRSNLIVKVTLTAARFVQRGLPFRGLPGELSPYNPSVRLLSSEHAPLDAKTAASSDTAVYAKLLSRQLISPTIARFCFSISNPQAAGSWTPGQYVALAFEDEVGIGYSHMRDEDPKSLNDDYIRTFTISSSPKDLPHDQFEITIRNVGAVTNFLFRQNVRSGLEVPLNGFGGSFSLPTNTTKGEIIPFIAGGIGITPLLAQLSSLNIESLRFFWTVNIRDIKLVMDTCARYPSLPPRSSLYISGTQTEDTSTALQKLQTLSPLSISTRRIWQQDILLERDIASTWYLCAGNPLRKSLLSWLEGKKVFYEDFDY